MADRAKQEFDKIVETEIRNIRAHNEAPDTHYRDCSTYLMRVLSLEKYRSILSRILGPEGIKLWDSEPHLRENLLTGAKTHTLKLGGDRFMKLQLDAPQKVYERPNLTSCIYSSVHVGQRKLLIGEIYFLSSYEHKSKNVIYIGAACGSHIPVLCELFGEHKFILYDPGAFSKVMTEYAEKNPDRVSIHRELFPPEDKSKKSYKELEKITSSDQGFLLISDIRRKDASEENPTNQDVIADMQLQVEICRKMQPIAAHLKCRLHYFDPDLPEQPDEQVTLPKGDLFFQPWCGHASTETRLVIEPPYSDDNVMSISAKWYESALAYHNRVTRVSRFDHSSLGPLALFVGTVYDECYDCTFERYVLWHYVSQGRCAYKSVADVYSLCEKYIKREAERLLKAEASVS
jgi:hypothetical protein